MYDIDLAWAKAGVSALLPCDLWRHVIILFKPFQSLNLTTEHTLFVTISQN